MSSSGDWSMRAACRDMDTEVFFPDAEKGLIPPQVEMAKAVCARCPVSSDCLTYAERVPELHGVWGGLTADERRRRRSGSHHGKKAATVRDQCGTVGGSTRHYEAGEEACQDCKAARSGSDKRGSRADRVDKARCGTVSGRRAHDRRGEEPCEACREAERAYRRDWYKRRNPDAKPRVKAKCGTRSGHRRHRRDGEDPCDACREAERSYHAARVGTR